MKRLHLLAIAVPALLIAVLMTSCGQTYHLQSIVLSPPSSSIEGISNYASFRVMAQNSNGKSEDVTTQAVFTLSAPSNLSASGQAYMLSNVKLSQGIANQLQATGPVCTWTWIEHKTVDSSGKATYTYDYGTTPMMMTATYRGMTSTGTVSINSQIGCYNPQNPAPDGSGSGTGLPN